MLLVLERDSGPSNMKIMLMDKILLATPDKPLRLPIWGGNKFLAQKVNIKDDLEMKLQVIASDMELNPQPKFEGITFNHLGMNYFNQDLSVEMQDIKRVLFSHEEVNAKANIDNLFAPDDSISFQVDIDEVKDSIQEFLEMGKLINDLELLFADDKDEDRIISVVKKVISENLSNINAQLEQESILFYSNFNQSRLNLIQNHFANGDSDGTNFIFYMLKSIIKAHPFKYSRQLNFTIKLGQVIQDWLNIAHETKNYSELVEGLDQFQKAMYDTYYDLETKMFDAIKAEFDNYNPINRKIKIIMDRMINGLVELIPYTMLYLTDQELEVLEERLMPYFTETHLMKKALKLKDEGKIKLVEFTKLLSYFGMVPMNMHTDPSHEMEWYEVVKGEGDGIKEMNEQMDAIMNVSSQDNLDKRIIIL